MRPLISDLRYGLRTLGKNPGFASIVILILAIGIGANTVMFSIVDSVLLRSLPFREPDRLFAVQEQIPKLSRLASALPVSAHHFLEWRREWHAWQQLAIFNTYATNLTTGGEPQRLSIARVSPEMFPMLGIMPEIGRNLSEDENRPGSDKVVLLSDALWRRRFHADPSILGQKLLLDDVPYTVVGVLPAEPRIPREAQLQAMNYGNFDPDLWKPLAIQNSELDEMGDFNFACIARLKPGYTPRQALDELNAIQRGIIEKYVKQPVELRALLEPLQAQVTGRSRTGLLMLLGAVGAVLLIVCVNIANLLLSRAAGRHREFAIRAAVGASSGRLLRQMLTESALIALLGGALGVGLAYAALRMVIAGAPANLPRLNEIRIDGTALTAAVVLTAFSAILFGLLPAWKSARGDLQTGLRSGGRSATESRQAGRLRGTLVGFEVALSTICLVAAGLLLNSFVRLIHVDRGFAVDRITTVTLNMPTTRYPDTAHRADFLRKVLDQVKAEPGVSGAAISNMIPLTAEGNNNQISAEGSTVPQIEQPIADRRLVSQDYFRVLGIPLLQGRFFEDEDHPRTVAILSAETAQRLWPGENPLGKRMRMGGLLMEVVGVVGDVRSNGLQKTPSLTVYQPYWQNSQREMTLAVRTAMDPSSIAGSVRGAIRSLDAEIAVPEFRTMEQIVSASVAERRFQLDLVLLFSAIALVLACLGIYGVVSYSVSQRRNEMGIRIALGATGGNVRRLILRQGLAPVAVGLIAGIVGSIVVGKILTGLLFGISSSDPLTLGIVSLALLMAAFAACYFPAKNATRIDPLIALRCD